MLDLLFPDRDILLSRIFREFHDDTPLHTFPARPERLLVEVLACSGKTSGFGMNGVLEEAGEGADPLECPRSCDGNEREREGRCEFAAAAAELSAGAGVLPTVCRALRRVD